jgi:hypothetical protein
VKYPPKGRRRYPSVDSVDFPFERVHDGRRITNIAGKNAKVRINDEKKDALPSRKIE